MEQLLTCVSGAYLLEELAEVCGVGVLELALGYDPQPLERHLGFELRGDDHLADLVVAQLDHLLEVDERAHDDLQVRVPPEYVDEHLEDFVGEPGLVQEEQQLDDLKTEDVEVRVFLCLVVRGLREEVQDVFVAAGGLELVESLGVRGALLDDDVEDGELVLRYFRAEVFEDGFELFSDLVLRDEQLLDSVLELLQTQPRLFLLFHVCRQIRIICKMHLRTSKKQLARAKLLEVISVHLFPRVGEMVADR